MTIEIRQLVIRAVVQAPPQPVSPASDAEIVARCTRAVLRQLARQKER
ncbi:MAG: DUF5908 family protein [Cyanobacteriota bacterium]|jgi:hypothetical protein|nr:DUF5908 family protein [Cyanobacteriota bacterium]